MVVMNTQNRPYRRYNSKVEVGSIYVTWIAAAVPGGGSQSPTTPAEQQDPKKLTLLSCFSHANWQIGDWCFLPTYAKFSTSVTINMEDIVSEGEAKRMTD
jgi:ubiquitin-conjugating enzyme E2 O